MGPDDVAAPAGAALVSVGYEGRGLPELVALLRGHGVTVLVDVRLNAVSRKPGLAKTKLREGLAQAGIGYRHARALGNPPENRAAFRAGDAERGLTVFARLLVQPAAVEELAVLVGLLATERVAVLCFEREHHRCHRQAVVGLLADRTGLPVLTLE